MYLSMLSGNRIRELARTVIVDFTIKKVDAIQIFRSDVWEKTVEYRSHDVKNGNGIVLRPRLLKEWSASLRG